MIPSGRYLFFSTSIWPPLWASMCRSAPLCGLRRQQEPKSRSLHFSGSRTSSSRLLLRAQHLHLLCVASCCQLHCHSKDWLHVFMHVSQSSPWIGSLHPKVSWQTSSILLLRSVPALLLSLKRLLHSWESLERPSLSLHMLRVHFMRASFR